MKYTGRRSKRGEVNWRLGCFNIHDSHKSIKLFIYLFGVFASLSTLYRSYHDGYLEGQRKPVHRVR